MYIYTDKTSLKADREDWGGGLNSPIQAAPCHWTHVGSTLISQLFPWAPLRISWLHLMQFGFTWFSLWFYLPWLWFRIGHWK